VVVATDITFNKGLLKLAPAVDHAATIFRLRRGQLEQAFIKGDVGRHHHDPGDSEVGGGLFLWWSIWRLPWR
jgi:hypothetical protein